jgi:hypothetical protein
MFFDPDPEVSHPLEDLAQALMWSVFNRDTQHIRQVIMAGYQSNSNYDDIVLQACLFLKLLEKWQWWLHRGKSEEQALDWIRKTKRLFLSTKKKLEMAA